jgi:hypothetical protein
VDAIEIRLARIEGVYKAPPKRAGRMGLARAQLILRETVDDGERFCNDVAPRAHHSCKLGTRREGQPSAVGNNRRPRCVVSGLLLTMGVEMPMAAGTGQPPANAKLKDAADATA